jgi:hypothetical protein
MAGLEQAIRERVSEKHMDEVAEVVEPIVSEPWTES